MLPQCHKAADIDSARGVASTNPAKDGDVIPTRIAGITIKDHKSDDEDLPEDQMNALWGVLDMCAAAERRAHGRFGFENIPAALAMIDMGFPYDMPANASILGPLTTDYPALTRSLRVMRIAYNDSDESDDIAAFADLATHLQELTFWNCELTSIRDLEGRCEFLKKVNIWGCRRLRSLDGLEHHLYLEEVWLSYTAVTSLAPLRSCPALAKVYIPDCEHLSSLEGLEGHRFLDEVNAAYTPLTSLEPLRTCPALTKVYLQYCHLSSLDGLEGHQFLAEVDASGTGITSVEPLQMCPALTMVDFSGCQQVSSLEALTGHQWLKEVNASETAIRSLEPLRTCPALAKVTIHHCQQLSSLEPLESHQCLMEVDVSYAAISSLEALRTCPALTKVVLRGCQHLTDVGLPADVRVIR